MQNIETTASKVEAITGYTFTNKLLCAEAVQMASPQIRIVYNGSKQLLNNNKRLSILGNAVLAKVLCATWFGIRDDHGTPRPLVVAFDKVNPLPGKTHSPTSWTTLRNEILSSEGLAQRGNSIGIDACIFAADATLVRSAKMVAMTMEAIIGAVYEDGGDSAVLDVMTGLNFLNHPLLLVTFAFPPSNPLYKQSTAIG
jgi:ribonuclease-3